ncbi:hypothetical protein COLO4_01136, partial [Corchorus olitorius]
RGGTAADFSVPGAEPGLASAGWHGRRAAHRAAGDRPRARYLAPAVHSDRHRRVVGVCRGNGRLYDHRRRARRADGDAVAGGQPARGKLDAGGAGRALGRPRVCAAALYRPGRGRGVARQSGRYGPWRAHNPAGAAAGSRSGGADGGLRLLRGQHWLCGADCPAHGAPAAARWSNRAPDGKRRAGRAAGAAGG